MALLFRYVASPFTSSHLYQCHRRLSHHHLSSGKLTVVLLESLCFHSYPSTSRVAHSSQLNSSEYKLDCAPLLLQGMAPSIAFSVPLRINLMSSPQSFNRHSRALSISSPPLLLLSFSLIVMSFFFLSRVSNSFLL